jgi:hypothetical protein
MNTIPNREHRKGETGKGNPFNLKTGKGKTGKGT